MYILSPFFSNYHDKYVVYHKSYGVWSPNYPGLDIKGRPVAQTILGIQASGSKCYVMKKWYIIKTPINLTHISQNIVFLFYTK